MHQQPEQLEVMGSQHEQKHVRKHVRDPMPGVFTSDDYHGNNKRIGTNTMRRLGGYVNLSKRENISGLSTPVSHHTRKSATFAEQSTAIGIAFSRSTTDAQRDLVPTERPTYGSNQCATCGHQC